MTLFLFRVFACCSIAVTAAVASESEDISRLYGANSMISLATGYSRPLFDSPATAYTITREQIEALGADNLHQVIETLPGFYAHTNDGRAFQASLRGITNRVLILVNGLPVDEGLLSGTLSVDDILTYDLDRVEITVGPGSALFGADAVAATINLITRTSTAAPINEVGALGGNEHTYSVHLVHNGSVGSSAHFGFYGAAYSSDDEDSILKADAQTRLDQVFHTHASLAPGPLNLGRKVVDSRGELSGDEWTARASYRKEYDDHTGTGLAFALDPAGTYDSALTTAELVGHHATANDWNLRGYIIFTEVGQSARDLHLYPPGAFGGAFPQGVIQNFDIKEDRFRGETSAEYTAFASQRWLFGLGAFHDRFDGQSDVRNYIVRHGVVIPTHQLAEFVNDAPILSDATSTAFYVFAQDEWRLSRDWILTAGGRFDHYSEFGGTFNPRVSLVWNESARTVFKLLYGRAFRPPSILELNSNGTYAPLGNPHLKPVTLDMLELSLDQRYARGTWGASVFTYQQTHLVEAVPNATAPLGLAYANRPEKDRSWGTELSGEILLDPQWSIQSHYTYQRHTIASADDPDISKAPRHQLYAQLQWQPTADWSTSLRGLYIAGRERNATDPRPDPKNYVVSSLTIQRRNVLNQADLRLSVDNLFNTAYSYPSNSAAVIPYDVPAPGRMWYLNLIVRF